MNTQCLPLFGFAWFNNFRQSLQDLATMAMNEEWDYKNAPTGNFPILFNYIHHTFTKLQCENKIECERDYCIFNSGLVTENQEEIYAYFQKNRRIGTTIEWYFIGWRKKSERDLMKFAKLPDVANYFHNPADLIYDTRVDLRINFDHIISDNKNRFPSPIVLMDNYQLGNLLQGTVDDAKRRVRRNYKTAIPQYYKGKIQLLLPLCLVSKSRADLALVVDKENGTYRASTILTLDMALNNARLVAKPDDEWLKP